MVALRETIADAKAWDESLAWLTATSDRLSVAAVLDTGDGLGSDPALATDQRLGPGAANNASSTLAKRNSLSKN